MLGLEKIQNYFVWRNKHIRDQCASFQLVAALAHIWHMMGEETRIHNNQCNGTLSHHYLCLPLPN
jgi:hypothetical protein